jgi:hypothetical protein
VNFEIEENAVRHSKFSDLTAWSGGFPDLLSASKGISIGPTTLTDPVGAVRLFEPNHPRPLLEKEGRFEVKI